MIRTLSVACVLVLCGTGAAHAQDAARHVDAISAYSAQISPSGKEVALIRRTDDAQQLLVADLAAKTSRVIQSVKEAGTTRSTGSAGRVRSCAGRAGR